ncbi:MAG: DUF4867 family protein [Bacilli bacterium]|nr:DUF4867 family protein [Bacilli bacterium]
MEIKSVFDADFKRFGRVVEGDFTSLLASLKETPLPEKGAAYSPSCKELESEEMVKFFEENVYGEMPIQLGYCNGHNQQLNCLEYHKGSEVNLANEDFILLLGSVFDIEDGKLDTSKVVAFKVPAGVAVEVYGTSLHYTPCGVNGSAFKVLIVLPKGTNVNPIRGSKDKMLWATNKWLLAHKDSNAAAHGAYVGLVGENIKI